MKYPSGSRIIIIRLNTFLKPAVNSPPSPSSSAMHIPLLSATPSGLKTSTPCSSKRPWAASMSGTEMPM